MESNFVHTMRVKINMQITKVSTPQTWICTEIDTFPSLQEQMKSSAF